MTKKCQLCDLEHKTKWYYEDKDWVICNCLTCKIPMIVYRKHLNIEDIPCSEISYIVIEAMNLFGKVTFRTEQKQIPSHFHWHIITNRDDLDCFDDVKGDL